MRDPGPGDEITWPAYYGHPHDPRRPDPTDYTAMTDAERIAERETQTIAELARDLVEAERRIEKLERERGK